MANAPQPPHAGTFRRQSKDGSLRRLAQNVRSTLPDSQAMLIYGSANSDPEAGDVDLAVIVKNGANRFDSMRNIAPILAEQIIQSGALTTCFPIEFGIYSEQASQFVKNVRSSSHFL